MLMNVRAPDRRAPIRSIGRVSMVKETPERSAELLPHKE
jgi:hypothetical protein